MPTIRATARLLPVAFLLLAARPASAQSPFVPTAPSVGAPAPAVPVAPGVNPALAPVLAEIEANWTIRDQPGKMDADLALLKKAEAIAPSDYEFLWRMARHWYWLADDPSISNEEKARLGKLTWEWSDKANKANPSRVEGWFYGSAGVGMYSLGISIVKALLDGMESKYTDRLEKSQAADPSYYGYGAYVSWGRYWYELPWPKYDAAKSEINFQIALGKFPGNLRAKVYLAELYVKLDRPDKARKLLEAVLAATPGAYDAPEERRAQGLARAVLARMK